MEPKAVKKIVVIGPESTGKSTLIQQLATHYQTLACPEYARAFLLENGTGYTFEDLLTIAKGQLALEDQMMDERWKMTERYETNRQPSTTNHQLLFIDTDMYVMKVWCEYVFGKCHQFILDEIVQRKYDLYLFCNIDMPWVKDELREYPDEQPRRELYRMYKDILINQNTPWADISGGYEERFHKALQAMETLM